MPHAALLPQPVLRRTQDGCRWHVLPGWEPLLLGSEGLPLARWLAERRAVRVKHLGNRAIYRVELDSRAIYVKHHRCRGPIQTLAAIVRGSPARREWLCAVEAFRRNIATARPIAFGERTSRGLLCESYFVTEAIDGAETLDQFVLRRLESFPPAHRRRARRLLLHRAARFLAAVHQAGLRHRDFHAGNLLVAPDEIDNPRRPALYLIDLARASYTAPLDWAAARDCLVVLHAEWFDRLSPAERWRFLRTYLAARPELAHPPRKVLLDELDRGARAHSRRIDRGRDRRALRDNRDFRALGSPGRRLWAVRELPDSLVAQLFHRPERLLGQSLDYPVKISHTTLFVRAEVSLDDHVLRIGLKRCRPRNAWKALAGCFRPSRARRAWYLGHALLARRIATARPLAACERRRHDHAARSRLLPSWFPAPESYLAVEWIDEAENLHLWAWALAERPVVERLRLASRCAESLGRLIGRMHARCVSHRDLKGSNLLVSADGSELRTWLVDVDPARIRRRLSASRRAADLARLATSVEAHPWVTCGVRYRFLRAYAAQFPRGDIDEKALWRAVARRARRQVNRKRRRGKPLL
jgi:tRNA A-37 threonylcarbamoyl transferase component Bud32